MTDRIQNPAPPFSPPPQEVGRIDFPLSGEALRAETLALLQETIWAPEDVKRARDEQFPEVWEANYATQGIKQVFGPLPEASPFSDFSSQGWKLHIAFEKGSEKDVSKFLFRNGLHFKTEAGIGTYFNGNRESGSTIYAGGMDAVGAIAGYVEGRLKPSLKSGMVQQFNGRTVSCGSGADVELLPKVTARFDMGKTAYVDKYVYDSGPASWVTTIGLPTGLPFLREDARIIADLERQCQTQTQRLPELIAAYRQAFGAAKTALVADFGEDYVLGTSPFRRRVLEVQ